MSLKVGIFGGTFNPIHIGHLALANYLREFEGLDEVWFMVSPQNPFKKDQILLDDHIRLEMVQEAVKAADALKAEGVSVRVIDMHTIKPLDEELVLRAARETGAIVTSEEANVIGGLGSAVCECVSAGCPVPVVRHGVNDEFGRSGAAKKVLAAYGLTADGIVESVRKALALKK